MKRSMLLPLVLLMISTMRAYAQNLPPRWSLGLAAGPAFPIGNFHHFTAADGSSVSAQTGGSIELSGALRVWRALSATLVIEGQENGGTGVDYSFILPGTAGKPIGSSKGNDWKIARVLAGAVYSWPLTKKTGPALLVRLLGGVQQTISPDTKESPLSPFPDGALAPGPFRTSPGPAVYDTRPGLTFPWAFSYEADAGLQWRFRGRLSAIGYVGYEGSKPSINLAYINSVNYANNTYTTTHQRSSYATNTISLHAGVSYTLTR
jgi:hypothetical protein